ncbi:MAG: hypothetical protein VKO21_03135 [Candidatus Sericytochromatia bacterium]|nr:hypothetical protein [Candidatus Sericytochromatia bacterium]
MRRVRPVPEEQESTTMATLGSIHSQGVKTTLTVSSSVQNILAEIEAKAGQVGQKDANGKEFTPQEFQAWILSKQTQLDMLSKLLKAVEDGVRKMHQ